MAAFCIHPKACTLSMYVYILHVRFSQMQNLFYEGLLPSARVFDLCLTNKQV